MGRLVYTLTISTWVESKQQGKPVRNRRGKSRNSWRWYECLRLKNSMDEQVCVLAYRCTTMRVRAGCARWRGRMCKCLSTARLMVQWLSPLASAPLLAKLTVLSRSTTWEFLCDLVQWKKKHLLDSFLPPVVPHSNEAHPHSLSKILMTEAFWLSLWTL